ncbi:retrotransposon protein, putative, ty1-copia subclass [Tanacetum coccineum]
MCFYCNTKGHWKRSCPKYLKDLKDGKVEKDGVLESFDFKSDDVCESCLLGKMTKSPFIGTCERGEGLLNLVHTDVCGPSRSTTKDGKRYYVSKRGREPTGLKDKEESFGYLFYKPKDNVVFIARKGVFLEREMISKEDSGSGRVSKPPQFYYGFHIEEDKISDSTLSELDEPANYKEAMPSPEAAKWKKAMKRKI